MKTVALLFGGASAEHEISIKSAKAIYKNLDRSLYNPLLIYINKAGKWAMVSEDDFIKENYIQLNFNPFLPWRKSIPGNWFESEIDIYFPVLHGPNGEDGKIQAMFELAKMPYVGPNSAASLLAMDKSLAKLIFKNEKLKTPDYLVFREKNMGEIEKSVKRNLSLPVFVKPCSLGSSVGISKVNVFDQLPAAIENAFTHDHKIIVEQGISGREIEIAVLGNHKIRVSSPGEVIPFNEFYDYKDKYIDGKTSFKIPVKLPKPIVLQIKKMAIQAFLSLGLNGMSRIDFFLEKSTNVLYINEINTIPGFTEISMFPKLWEVEGLCFTNLVTELINLGFEYANQLYAK
jgi:D-alanine-D-alanine ligase